MPRKWALRFKKLCITHEGNKTKTKGVQAKPMETQLLVPCCELSHVVAQCLGALTRSISRRSISRHSSPGPAELDPGLASRECEGMNRGPHGQGMVFVCHSP